MIYIKRFLYLLFMIVITIFGYVTFFIIIITFPFIAMVDYIVHGEITTDPIMKIFEWLDEISNKFNPE